MVVGGCMIPAKDPFGEFRDFLIIKSVTFFQRKCNNIIERHFENKYTIENEDFEHFI